MLFEAEEIILQHSVLGYRNAYFFKQKLAIEVNEQVHNSRDISYDIEIQRAIEKELDCEFIRINPAEEDFNILLRLVEYIVLLLCQ